jgi:antitoxin (DNA-binding transcriptional repressor) of toxin-antitoxin stability system
MYTVHKAQKNFDKLLLKAARGEEVIIARGKKPIAKLVAFSVQNVERKKRVPGRLKGKIRIRPSFFDPMTKEELADWGID